MFDFVRSHTRLFQGILVLLVFPSFVFFGVQGYSSFTDAANSKVAEVDGHGITQAEWNAAHQRNIERVRQQMPSVDMKLLDSPAARAQTLEGIVRERVLLAAANDLHLGVGDERLHRLFASDPQFAALRNPDGSVNRDLLAAQGMSSEMFAQSLRQDLAMRQVMQGIGATAIAPKAVADTALDALLQRRQVQFQRFDAQAMRDEVHPSDAEIEAFYKAHEAQFRAPEQARIEYVVLDLQTLQKGVTVSDDELQRFYAENASRYTTAEERRASHILVKADKDLSAAERQKARAKADALLEQLRKSPGQFAELAKKNSDDPGSAERGGDLDYFGRGAMVKPFEDAVFAMKPGEISNVVASDFGYHIIQLTGVRGGEKRPFEQVRAEIEAEVKKQLAQKRFAEAAEQFTNTVYEQPESLQPVIDKLKLEKHTALVQRTPAPGAVGALGSAKLLEAVFADDALRNKRNTDAVEVGPNQLASARVLEHLPARTLPLAEVKEQVRARLVAEQAAALARKEGQALLAQLRKDATLALPHSEAIGRMSAQQVPVQVIDAVLAADAAKLPVPLGVDLGEQGFWVGKVMQVLPRDAALADTQALQTQYAQAVAAAQMQAYFDALKERYKVEIKPAVAALSAPAQTR
ncbi:MAG TPA: SurA N-terminal domain-containing protein [Rubrivivax sp.]|nr:SurA N-terminal domain-containing protein [Rubrivivax sp.]HPO18889.1 SurA N-terminal domain-containing protein [Rubrivivax sp.]